MKLLLDTRILLWSLSETASLSANHRAAIESPQNEVWISAVSIWEVAIKMQSGRLRIPNGLTDAISAQDFEELSLKTSHCLEILNLPMHHRDPFDRALIAQARVEKMHLVTLDQKMALYQDLVILLPG